MAEIHHTTAKPTKLELLTEWLPTRLWYRGGSGAPELAKAGGFRLDDPEGEVGIEFLIVTDAAGDQPVTYLVPLTYRGAPLDGAEDALVGTMEHGVLGKRWVYDGCHDPVLVAQLVALIEGRAEAQAQDVSDTPDRDVASSGAALSEADLAAGAADDQNGTELAGALRLNRVLHAAPEATGHVVCSWRTTTGTHARGPLVVAR
ncbi:1,4-alpha-glucan branching protein [Nonomuraea sp. NPDC050310]|uniref:maltokinase N-terminal cap-like domain-containing protein n=1 Tax=Nonomuraea sp. NPDC050310 TaxID=3154935 RepID=UPI0033D78BEA